MLSNDTDIHIVNDHTQDSVWPNSALLSSVQTNSSPFNKPATSFICRGFISLLYIKKNVKSHKKYQVCWMSIEILASKLPDVRGTYSRLSHSSHGLSTLLSKMFDVGDRDLPVPVIE